MRVKIIVWSIIVILIIILSLINRNKDYELYKKYSEDSLLNLELGKTKYYRIFDLFWSTVFLLSNMYSLMVSKEIEINNLISPIFLFISLYYSNRAKGSVWFIHEKGIIRLGYKDIVPWKEIKDYEFKEGINSRGKYGFLEINRYGKNNMIVSEIGLIIEKHMIKEADELMSKLMKSSNKEGGI